METRRRWPLPFAAFCLASLWTAAAVSGAPFVVDSTGDQPDDNTVDNLCHTAVNTCTLRAAILQANATFGPDVILFAIPGAGVQMILPTSPLPAITESVILDGYSQPGSSANALSTGNNAVILIEIDGSNAGAIPTGLIEVASSSVSVRGLSVVHSQGDGIVVSSGSGVFIFGNFVGLLPDGNTTGFNGCAGVRVGGSNNIVGTAAPADRNVIADTSGCGIDLVVEGSSNTVLNNYIGTNAAGTVSHGATIGVDVTGTNHTIGAPGPGGGNVISGHANPYGGPSLNAGAERSFVFGGQCGIPSTAAAVAVNVVAINSATGPGFLTLYPGGTTRPGTATINYNAGKIRANNAVIPLGTANDIAVHCGQGFGTVDMVIDVNGFFQ